jgi:hypothetical protein
MDQIIKFNPVSEITRLSVPAPKPAREFMPEWYKSIPAFQDGKPSFNKSVGITDRTIKMCMPFADSLSIGYIQQSWQEINFVIEEVEPGVNSFNYYYPTKPDIVGVREQGKNHYPIPQEFYQFELTWHPVWIPELPEGYSAIITHPFNRTDLPFYTLTGIVDADTYNQSEEGSNLPFLLKSGFTGIIPIGTPMYQIIPFKREDWTSESNEYNKEAQTNSVQKLRQNFWGGYKKNHWVKKNYK